MQDDDHFILRPARRWEGPDFAGLQVRREGDRVTDGRNT